MRKIIKIVSLLIFLLIIVGIVGCKSSKNIHSGVISDHYNGKNLSTQMEIKEMDLRRFLNFYVQVKKGNGLKIMKPIQEIHL